jgi:hypothetical protein
MFVPERVDVQLTNEAQCRPETPPPVEFLGFAQTQHVALIMFAIAHGFLAVRKGIGIGLDASRTC